MAIGDRLGLKLANIPPEKPMDVDSHEMSGDGSEDAGAPPKTPGTPGTPKKDRDRLHRFEIQRKLGSGTYGKVSLAYDHKFNQEVAVKIIKKSAIENKQDLLRIRREIRIMSALVHPNIIEINEVFENKEKIIIVMEYASGGELYDYVSTHGSLGDEEARRIFRQITSAVFYCHKHKVAHRDLKLENILLDDGMSAKIADFGLSNYFGEKQLLSTFCGSPLYASPEIINGTPYKGPEVDCWSLGVLLYTLVYGSMPYDGRDFNRMIRQIKRGAYYEPDTPSSASMLIRTMLRVSPERRADIEDIAAHWWLNFDENMVAIRDLPENKQVDLTPLIDRKETMVVQALSDEADVFMEFSHLSASTRKKIEDFRRRRKDAERYIAEASPAMKRGKLTSGSKVSLRDSSQHHGPRKSVSKKMSSKNVVHPLPKPNPVQMPSPVSVEDPLARLKALEARLQGKGMENYDKEKSLRHAMHQQESMEAENTEFIPPIAKFRRSKSKTPPEPEPPRVMRDPSPEPFTRTGQRPLVLSSGKGGHVTPSPNKDAMHFENSSRFAASPIREAPLFSPRQRELSDMEKKLASIRAANEEIKMIERATAASRLETESLNMLVNQLLEEQGRGVVSEELIAKIKKSPKYATSPFVQELLQSVLQAQEQSKKDLENQQPNEMEQMKQTAIVRPTTLHTSDNHFDYTITPFMSKDVIQPATVQVAASVIVPQTDAGLPDLVQPQPTPAGSPRAHDIGDSNLPPCPDKPENQMRDQPDIVTTSRAGSYEELDQAGEQDDATVEAEEETVEDFGEDEMDGEQEEDEEEEEEEEEEDEEEEEKEEEVCSTDYEDLDSEDEEHSARGSEVKIVEPIQCDEEGDTEAADSFHSTQSNLNPTVQTLTVPFDRGLTKRQSRGKYEKSKHIHGSREVSVENGPELCKDWPQLPVGGVQPPVEIAPTLFNKAKQYILQYPNAIAPDSPSEMAPPIQRKMHWLKTQDPDMGSSQERDSPARTLSHIESDRSTGFPVQESPSLTEISQPVEPQAEDDAVQRAYYKILWPPQSPSDEVSLLPEQSTIQKNGEFKLQAPPPRRRSRTESQASSGQSQPGTPAAGGENYVSTAVVSLSATIDPTKEEANRAHIKFPDRKDLSPPRIFTFMPASMEHKSPSPTDTSRERDVTSPYNDGVTAAFIRKKRLSQEKRKRNRSTGYSPDETLFTKAAEILQKPLRDQDDKSYSHERLEALLSPRASVQYDLVADRTDPRRFSYRSAIEKSATPAYSVNPQPSETATPDFSSSSSGGNSTPLSPAMDAFYGPFLADGRPSLTSYIRPRYNNEIYKSHMNSRSIEAAEPPSSTSAGGGRLRYDQRHKSRSLHELSPSLNSNDHRSKNVDPPLPPRSYVPRYGYDRNIWQPGKTRESQDREESAPPIPPRRRKSKSLYEDLEGSKAIGSGHHAFDAADSSAIKRHTYYGVPVRYGAYSGLSSVASPPGAYTPSSLYQYEPTYKHYVGSNISDWYLRRQAMTALGSQGENGPYYRSKFDDNVTYRRSYYDVENDANAAGHDRNLGSRFSAPWKRSQSLDKSVERQDSAGSARGGRSGRVSDAKPVDYHYVSYFDTSGATRRDSGPKNPMDIQAAPAKGILKKSNQSSLEDDSIGNSTSSSGQKASKYSVDSDPLRSTASSGKSAPSRFMDKIKRHLSSEKINTAGVKDTSTRTNNNDFSNGSSGYGSSEKQDLNSEKARSKRRFGRNVLDRARRRTTEIILPSSLRSGATATNANTTSSQKAKNAELKEEVISSRRPSSPLERLKGFFSPSTHKSQPKTPTAAESTNRYSPAKQIPPTGAGDKISVYNPTTTSSVNPSNYRKLYTSSGASYRPHSYVPMGRYWYEDPSLY